MGVTIRQIAEIAGVSRGTVDRAINNRGRIDSEVAKKILKIADELGYVPKHQKKPNKKVDSKIDKKIDIEYKSNKTDFKYVKTYLSKIKIGIILQRLNSSADDEILKGIKDAEKILSFRNFEFIIKYCSDISEQKKCINDILNEYVSAMAIMPFECDEIRNAINSFNKPVVTFNSDIIGTKRVCFVGFDDFKSGKVSADVMGKVLGNNGSVIVITGYFSNTTRGKRVDGFIEEMKLNYPNIKIVGVQSSFDDSEALEKIVENSILTYDDLKGIFIVSNGQKGIKNILSHNKKQCVIVYDNTKENRELLNNNIIDFIIGQDFYFQGYKPPFILADIILKGIYPNESIIYKDINIYNKYNT